jgi:hypothetical protein
VTHPTSALQIAAAPIATLANPDVSASALALAKLTNSEALMIGNDDKALAAMSQIMQSSPDIMAMEKDYPGIMIEMAKAAMPVTNQDLRDRLPTLWDRQAALYSETFTASELEVLIRFYGSPTGEKLLRGLQQHLKPEASITEARQTEGFTFGANSALKDIQAAVPDVIKDMDQGDRGLMALLGKSSAFPKLQAIAPRTQQIALDWINEPSPEADARMDAVMQAVVEARLGTSKSSEPGS